MPILSQPLSHLCLQLREGHLRDAPVSNESDNQSVRSLVDDDDDVSSESSIPPRQRDAEESDTGSSFGGKR